MRKAAKTIGGFFGVFHLMIVVVVMVMIMVVVMIVVVMVMIVMICFMIVQPKQIHTKIVRDVPPHRVDMVRIVLRVIILHEEKRTVQPIVVRCLRRLLHPPMQNGCR